VPLQVLVEDEGPAHATRPGRDELALGRAEAGRAVAQELLAKGVVGPEHLADRVRLGRGERALGRGCDEPGHDAALGVHPAEERPPGPIEQGRFVRSEDPATLDDSHGEATVSKRSTGAALRPGPWRLGLAVDRGWRDHAERTAGPEDHGVAHEDAAADVTEGVVGQRPEGLGADAERAR
jgi:hypothetical protein